MKTISAAEFKESAKNCELIDVRTPKEFRECHIAGAKNIPLDVIKPKEVIEAREGDADSPIYIVCQKGARGEMACKKFIEAGFDNVVNVVGGTAACVDCGHEINHGKKAMSLERQVRIAAGALVVFGIVLAWLVNPGFIGLSAFVGLGLMFAGITDTCGMGMLISKMPWNK